MNLGSVVSIVVVNKLVLYTYGFKFAATLTWLHTIFTAVGMAALGAMEVFPVKRIPVMRTAPIAAAYVASIVLNNMSLQLNTVGFYQISKILITPAVIAIDYVLYRRTITFLVGMSTVVLMAGVALATLADKEVSTNPVGTAVALLCVVVTGLYQVWAGAKQKELDVTAMQLLHQVSPVAVVLLALLIPLLEPVGFTDPGPETVLGYTFTTKATLCIAVSCVLGLLVTLSTFLFIGATSSLTYNVVGHLKTVGIISAGLMFFGDTMPLPKLAGLLLAMGGIVWYTHLKMQPAAKPAAK
jgi:solute carrier family 35 protein E3